MRLLDAFKNALREGLRTALAEVSRARVTYKCRRCGRLVEPMLNHVGECGDGAGCAGTFYHPQWCGRTTLVNPGHWDVERIVP